MTFVSGVTEFPDDVFTQQQRRYGAVILHIIMVNSI